MKLLVDAAAAAAPGGDRVLRNMVCESLSD